MSIKKGNRIIPVNLPIYHQKKLEMVCQKLGVSKSELIKRLIEGYSLFQEPTKEDKNG